MDRAGVGSQLEERRELPAAGRHCERAPTVPVVAVAAGLEEHRLRGAGQTSSFRRFCLHVAIQRRRRSAVRSRSATASTARRHEIKRAGRPPAVRETPLRVDRDEAVGGRSERLPESRRAQIREPLARQRARKSTMPSIFGVGREVVMPRPPGGFAEGLLQAAEEGTAMPSVIALAGRRGSRTWRACSGLRASPGRVDSSINRDLLRMVEQVLHRWASA